MEQKTQVTFREQTVKGVARCLLDSDLQGEPLHVHISEVGPGERSHPPHRHDGYEAFYMLEGEGTLEIEDETVVIGPNEVVVFDPQKLHGLINRGDVPMRYMVILSK